MTIHFNTVIPPSSTRSTFSLRRTTGNVFPLCLHPFPPLTSWSFSLPALPHRYLSLASDSADLTVDDKTALAEQACERAPHIAVWIAALNLPVSATAQMRTWLRAMDWLCPPSSTSTPASGHGCAATGDTGASTASRSSAGGAAFGAGAGAGAGAGDRGPGSGSAPDVPQDDVDSASERCIRSQHVCELVLQAVASELRSGQDTAVATAMLDAVLRGRKQDVADDDVTQLGFRGLLSSAGSASADAPDDDVDGVSPWELALR
jgi:hypothetical protein